MWGARPGQGGRVTQRPCCRRWQVHDDMASVVVAQASLFPTWLDHYLLDGTHLRRASPGADGLRRHAAWAAAHPNTSRRMARAGRRRICQLRRPGLHMDATAQPPGAPAAGLCASRAPTDRATRRGAG